MAKLTLGQKAKRTLDFLLGLRNPRLVAKLMAYGFSGAVLQEGWGLLRAVGKTQLDADPAASAHDSGTLKALDNWENKWFGISGLTLARHAPAANAWIFKNLSQTEGPAVILSVGTFIERVAKVDKAEAQGGLGPVGKAARKMLLERGLTDEVINEAKALIAALGAIHGPLPNLPDLDAEAEQLVQAENAMWAWYKEWSGIARRTIFERAQLRQLGFLRNGRPGGGDEDGEELADEEDEAEGDDAEGDDAEADDAEDPAAEGDDAAKPVAASKPVAAAPKPNKKPK